MTSQVAKLVIVVIGLGNGSGTCGATAEANEVNKIADEFKDNDIEQPTGKRGILIVTGTTSSARGNAVSSAFALEEIHIAHSIIGGAILMDRQRARNSVEWADIEDGRLSPESIASAYHYLVNQDQSAWTWELDLRPAHEQW